ncbi:stage II sporulation protein M [Methanotrichaceae archaeon M04Ac]|uniref:Stage II sporulation protein M n=1 Tax=Candidatus Methanocrinis alkalitolerans TaxID=3033395 RepID=A0ABT5XCG0_9EURY|nr:stage II sporulation protein M [Candidatus Methanocrinis alkalitolerans]MCR3883132.1 stage II sporulation protein M [Methanothrix sp.]MDF0592398.1 stage II sporulation protein M [Candidatus Methanocrinis alkalitolerans]
MNWKEDVTYIRSIRPYILLSVFLFLAAAILGFVISIFQPDLASAYVGDVAEKLRWILELSPAKMMVAIFANNLLASSMALLLGVGFGIVPFIVVVVNGLVVGLVVHQAVLAGGAAFVIVAILPHGIIELPTVLVCIAVGFRLGHLMILTLLGRDGDLEGELRAALRLLRWVVLLLFIAAAIETFITPVLVQPFIQPAADLQPLSVME